LCGAPIANVDLTVGSLEAFGTAATVCSQRTENWIACCIIHTGIAVTRVWLFANKACKPWQAFTDGSGWTCLNTIASVQTWIR